MGLLQKVSSTQILSELYRAYQANGNKFYGKLIFKKIIDIILPLESSADSTDLMHIAIFF